MDKNIKVKILTLFKQKNFIKLENFLIKTLKKEKPTAFLLNLLGLSKIQKPNINNQDLSEGLNYFKKAYLKDNSYLDALFNYALLGLNLNDYEVPLKKLVELSKKEYNPKVFLTLSRIFFFEGKIQKAHNLLKEVFLKNGLSFKTSSHFLSTFSYIFSDSQNEYLHYCQLVQKQFKLNECIKFEHKRSKKIKKLNIGFVSPDFCNHAISHFLLGTLEQLKNKNLELHAFNLREQKGFDETTLLYKNTFHKWHDVYDQNSFEIAKTIKNQNIDILFDICGYFSRNRFDIFFFKPAPIQISWLGYLNSTGNKNIDYIIADPYLIESKDKKNFVEKIIYMPNIWNCHSRIKNKTRIKDSPFKKNKYITFGSFNNSSKFSEQALNTWSEILLKKKDSHLILKSVNPNAEKSHSYIKNFFNEKKIDSSRVRLFQRTTTRDEHYEFYNQIDLSLDTFPYPGITTSFESIYMGVPVLTLKGKNYLSRTGYSINKNLNLTDFIATDIHEYINKAVEIDKNINILENLRKNLREIALRSPLFDMENFGRNFYRLLQKTWKNYNLK